MIPDPLRRYQCDLQQTGFHADPAQQRAVDHLQALYLRLLTQPKSLWRLWPWQRNPRSPVIGLYLWGGVGRGKTYLMDLFFESLPFEQKMRTHFHRFMRRVHADLTDLRGQKNPLDQVADRLAAEARVLCFDEFFVTDITDAMILANLLRALFERGVTLVATSNIPPDGLYKDGLQRENFLPAIALLQRYTQVLNVDNGTDYRLRTLMQARLYHLGPDAEQAMTQCFMQLAPGVVSAEAVELEVEGRAIRARRVADDVAWFDFSALCDGPRSQRDYIVLAHEYHAVLISDVPQFGPSHDDRARRFIYLVDEFYDRRVKLVLSAQVPLAELYLGGKLSFEFARTVSRLLEMQSEAYLGLAHRP